MLVCAVGSVCVNIFEINKFPGTRHDHVTDRLSASIRQSRSKCKSMSVLPLSPHEVMISVNNQLTLIRQRDNLAILIAVCHKHVRGNCSRETSHCLSNSFSVVGHSFWFCTLNSIVPIFTFVKVEKVYVMY